VTVSVEPIPAAVIFVNAIYLFSYLV